MSRIQSKIILSLLIVGMLIFVSFDLVSAGWGFKDKFSERLKSQSNISLNQTIDADEVQQYEPYYSQQPNQMIEGVQEEMPQVEVAEKPGGYVLKPSGNNSLL